jgi:hypothetical protein
MKVARVKKALQSWTALLSNIASEGAKKQEINSRIDPGKLSHSLLLAPWKEPCWSVVFKTTKKRSMR